jgi:drug/metabolite transporter, DME family
LLDPAYALVAAVIWAFSPIYYRGFLEKFDFLSFNLLRNLMASSVLLIPAAYLGFGGGAGLGYALVSGAVTLSCGDSMFLLAIRETGASVASPVVYTYVLMIQLLGAFLGQTVPAANFVAAGMVVAGVFLLSKGGGGRPRGRGITYAVLAGVAWTAGQELIQQATNAGGNVVAVTFTRNAAAALALGAAFIVTRSSRRWPTGLAVREYAFMALFILSDLVVGSLLFVYSISTEGVALTVILTSLSPLLTQVFSKALGKESPSPKDYLGGVLIVAAVVLAIAY